MAKKKTYTDRYLQMLWRKAVLSLFNNRCIVCNNGNVNELECHHFVKRKNKILRHDVKNGVPCCSVENMTDVNGKKITCHRFLDSLSGEDFLKEFVDFEYLKRYENMSIKQYLIDNGMSENEFLREKVNELKGFIINEPN